ncbi:MAG: DUF2157 domain-containing protein [Leptolyngbyaceae bacterium]|nr:DUF2157 domain-containing protein [Leptolyngbyaceae bacterium]
MVSEKFRRQLRQEATQWQADGWISADVYHHLAEQYDFDSIDAHARDRFVAVLVIIGGVLLGISVITFVAANWQAIPRSIKVVLLLSVLIAFNTAGFYLWRSPSTPAHYRSQWRNRLGHGFLICGSLIIGANLALMGQLFHQTGSAFGLCIIWGFGVVVMAYGLRLSSLAAIACVLVNVGYWTEYVSYSARTFPLPLTLIFEGMPLVLGLVFLPLAYWCQSRWVFGLTVVGVSASLTPTIFEPVILNDPSGLTTAIALTLPALFWWAYDDNIWQIITHRIRSGLRQAPVQEATQGEQWFRPVARLLTIIYLGGLFYSLSFHSVWTDYVWGTPPETTPFARVVSLLVTNPNVMVMALLAIAFWLCLGWPRIGHTWRLTTTDGVVLGMLGITAGLVIWDAAVGPIQIWATMMFNILLFLLAAGLMREGLDDGDRPQFWFGLALLILQIISRVFEYETGLLLKSFTFLLCGIGVIIIGLWFERYVRALSASLPPSPTSNSSEEI